MDSELAFVAEKEAPGVTAYREAIKTVFEGQKITSQPHEHPATLRLHSKLAQALLVSEATAG